MKTWDAKYMKMTETTARGDQLEIRFENGDVVTLAFSALERSGRSSIAWEDVRTVSDGLHIVVPAVPNQLSIPWHVIRSLTDSGFARHMAQAAEEQAHHIGQRLRMLRTQRNLTQREVAQRANLEPANLSRIESGRFDVTASTLWKILAALGCSPSDLADEKLIAAD